MGKLIYAALMSLDGYIADEEGNFDWAAPDAEVHAFVNDLERAAGTHLYGRRMYEVMAVWETYGSAAEESPEVRDYAQIWRAADKIVYSRTLPAVTTARTRLERDFDAEDVRRLKTESASDVSIGGPDLAASAFKAGLVDECHLFIAPCIVGGGKRGLPEEVRLRLQLLDLHRFKAGMVYLRYGATA